MSKNYKLKNLLESRLHEFDHDWNIFLFRNIKILDNSNLPFSRKQN